MIQLCWWLMIPVMIWPHSSEASSRLTHSRLRASFCAIVVMCSPDKAAPAILIRRVVRTASRRLVVFFVLVFAIRGVFEPVDAAVQLVHGQLGCGSVRQKLESVPVSYIPRPGFR